MKSTILVRIRCLALVLPVLLFCGACGQSGDLYLPGETPEKSSPEKKT